MRLPGCLLVGLAAPVAALPVTERQASPVAIEGSCSAGAGDISCAGQGPTTAPPREEYYWPHARGHVGHYGSTELFGPLNLTASLAWTWQQSQMQMLPGGINLDHHRNLYVGCMDGIRKFSPDGHIMWHSPPPFKDIVHANPSLMDGKIFSSTWGGHVFALDMETGEQLWIVQPRTTCELDSPYVESQDGVVMVALDRKGTSTRSPPGNTLLVGLNATNGNQLWEFTTDRIFWNYMPMFIGDGTFITMDIHGGIYRMGIQNGSKVWHTPPPEADIYSFTDGGVILGPGNRVAYTCSNHFEGGGFSGTKGALRAYLVSSGELVWDRELPEACVSWPAVDGSDHTLVVPVGALPWPVPPTLVLLVVSLALVFLGTPVRLGCCLLGSRCGKCPPRKVRRCFHGTHTLCMIFCFAMVPVLHLVSNNLFGDNQYKLWQFPLKPLEVLAFDAQTGAPRWRFNDIPAWGRVASRGDEEHLLYRLSTLWGLQRPVCGPASWSTPTFDGRGTIYVAGMHGIMYAVRDANGDGAIDRATEVSAMDLGAASLHGGSAFAPGLMAFASCDTLFAFRT